MGGLDHDFILLFHPDQPYENYMDFMHRPDAIQLHDDLLSYIADTLHWIASHNPAVNMMEQTGLNFYGPTVIKSDGAHHMKLIFEKWASLPEIGPSQLVLMGGYELGEDNTTDGQYSKLEFDRDCLIKSLKGISRMADDVVASQDRSYILHLGI